jgi:hypothetical protein
VASTDLLPGWHPDPSGRHRWRWYDGNRWSAVVADDDEHVFDDLRYRPPGRARGLVESAVTFLPLLMLALFIYFGTRR